ncbi:MAG: nickel-dependent hydrogenase large subunit [Magnetovibrionaceae bacterium]
MDLPVAGFEGRLNIDLTVKGGRVSDVSLNSSRPLAATKVLQGKSAAQALDMLGMMYNLCGIAQTVAGLEAIEQALGLRVADAQKAARSVMIQAESLEQISWRVFMDWPPLAGDTPSTQHLLPLREQVARLKTLVYPKADWKRLGGGTLTPDRDAIETCLAEIDRILAEALFADETAEPDQWGALTSGQTFEAWYRRGGTSAARMFRRIAEGGLAAFGAGPIAGMGMDLDNVSALTRQLSQRLDKEDDFTTSAEPSDDGEVLETGSLARLGHHPLIQDLNGHYANGLMTRLAARLLDLVTLTDTVRSCLDLLAPHRGGADFSTMDGTGTGVVETARGRLLHRVHLKDGQIDRYRMIAPTEWNFHPQGPLALGLEGQPVINRDGFEQDVALLVTALDPCVAFKINIQEHADRSRKEQVADA